MKYRDYLASSIARGPKKTRYERIRKARIEVRSNQVAKLLLDGCKWLVDYPEYLVSRTGDVYSTLSTKLTKLRPGVKPGGYEFVGLGRSDNRKYEMVHRLVAKTFIPNPRNLPDINHKDANKRNNVVENLEWTTPKDNTRHAYELGILKKGINNPLCVLNEDQVRQIRAAEGKYRDIGKKFGVCAQTVCNVKRRSGYADVA